MSAILDYLEQHRADMLADLREFVEQESPTTDKPRADAFAEFVAAYAERMTGGRSTLVANTGWGNHVLVRAGVPESTAEGSPSPPHVLLVGHFDTVWPAGTLEELPFRVEDGRARGPGVFDMKAGLVQGFWAIRALRQTEGGVPPLVFVLNSDEEVGSPSSQALIEEEARRAALCMVLEPSFDGALKTARKGVGIFKVRVEGRASHAGSEPFEGVSAIEEICRLTLDLHACTDRDTGTTVNVGVIAGGTRTNVVAAHAEADVDLRVASREEADRMERLILGLKPHHPEARVVVEGGMNRPPMERTPRIAQLYEQARALATELGFDLPEASVGGGSDGNFCAAVNPSVVDGLGAVGGGGHARSEHVVVEEMPRRAALVAALLRRATEL
jgi:glutamate carboxypeptidase